MSFSSHTISVYVFFLQKTFTIKTQWRRLQINAFNVLFVHCVIMKIVITTAKNINHPKTIAYDFLIWKKSCVMFIIAQEFFQFKSNTIVS